ncbi:probable methyltransferase PMT23 [Ziziphus jujuba]|uniref:Methyltransferase n=1 Tax=Ziziphus jujuba TaxID=326968 RepID=A0A6P3ZVB9_ZIZJJ|nr:probable methyltransferase PMT23 [Ziziphus jujuba]
MANSSSSSSSVRNLLKERTFPFLLTISVLFLSAIFLIFGNNFQYPFFSSDLQTQTRTHSVSISSPPSPTLSSKSEPNSAPGSVTPPQKKDGVPPDDVDSAPVTPPQRDDAVPANPVDDDHDHDDAVVRVDINWELCKGPLAVDYIPCLDNFKAIKALKSRRHMEHRERHCPDPSPRCLIPLPVGYKMPVPWPKSRDMIWYDNVPHPKLVEYKKEQNWVRKSGDYLVFPGGGTQFKDGVSSYIDFIEQTLPSIKWGKHIRVVLDVGCGVASFGGYLLDKNVITMSFAPKDEHEAQIQFALERGIPATLSVIGTQRLTFPDNAYDMIHCARCRVHWDANGGKPLLELNRILRPGGFFVWSATPVYRDDERDQNVWKAMLNITKSMCWKTVAKTVDSSGIGLVIYQKPDSYSCYENRKENSPPICDDKEAENSSWYVPLGSCISQLPTDSEGNLLRWPMPWPQRLNSQPPSLSGGETVQTFYKDTKYWSALVPDVYLDGLSVNWSSVRNIMDMNAGFGGFAAALVDLPVWVMNVVPVDMPNTLSFIFDRGLIGVYHDWCESLNTYPRTYDLIHSSFLFEKRSQRCEIEVIVAEMDRILRPGGYVVIQETKEMIKNLRPILQSLHWSLTLHQDRFLIGKKGFWRPTV